MRLILNWTEPQKDFHCLFAGQHPTEVAWLTRSKGGKQFKAVIALPGCSPQKEYDELDKQKADVEKRVKLWFELTLSPSLAAMEAEYGPYLGGK